MGIPAQPSWVIARPRITERLRKGTRGPLTVITGPPGAGKTIAAISWAAEGEAPGPIAWVTLQRGDDEQSEIFWHLVATARRDPALPLHRYHLPHPGVDFVDHRHLCYPQPNGRTTARPFHHPAGVMSGPGHKRRLKVRTGPILEDP